MVDPVTAAVVGAATAIASNPAGQAGMLQSIGEFSPAASAQRRAFQRAKQRLDTGVGYGMSQAEKNQQVAQGNQAVASQLSAQQANIARQQAAGMLGGGGATEAQRAVANAAAAGAAQNAAAIQQQSNALAQNQFAKDMALVDAQAARTRDFWRQNAERLFQEPLDVRSIAAGGSDLGSSPALTAGLPPGAQLPAPVKK